MSYPSPSATERSPHPAARPRGNSRKRRSASKRPHPQPNTNYFRFRTSALLLSIGESADIAVIENADGSCGFGRRVDADRREVTPVEATCGGFVGTVTAGYPGSPNTR